MVKPLSSFPRPANDNGWGVHGSTNSSYPLGRPEHVVWLADELEQMHMRWCKLVVEGDTGDDAVARLLGKGIMPVVRFYRHQPNGYYINGQPRSMFMEGDTNEKSRQAALRYAKHGVPYLQLNCEPNHFEEWADQTMPSFNEAIELVGKAYVMEARWMLDQGCPLPPLVPPPVPSDGLIHGLINPPTKAEQLAHPGGPEVRAYNELLWLEAFLIYVRDMAPDVVESGIAIGMHNAGLTHPIAYPNDPINVAEWESAKGRAAGIGKVSILTTWFPATGRPTGFANCWHKYIAFDAIARRVLGGSVPILSLEGGFWPGESADSGRYGVVTEASHAQLTLEAMQDIATAPSYYFCTGHWMLLHRLAENPDVRWAGQDWYQPGRHLPVVDVLKAHTPPLRKSITNGEAPIPGGVKVIETIRKRAWDDLGIALLPTAALLRVAREKGLGAPLRNEDDVTIDGVAYRYQEFAGGIVYAPVDKWYLATTITY